MRFNRFWIHLTLALTLVVIAAFAGQLRKWQKTRRLTRPSTTQTRTDPGWNEKDSESETRDVERTEVLVRFRSGVTRQTIDRITASLHDEVEDRIESVEGLDVIEDEDGKDAESVVAQY